MLPPEYKLLITVVGVFFFRLNSLWKTSEVHYVTHTRRVVVVVTRKSNDSRAAGQLICASSRFCALSSQFNAYCCISFLIVCCLLVNKRILFDKLFVDVVRCCVCVCAFRCRCAHITVNSAEGKGGREKNEWRFFIMNTLLCVCVRCLLALWEKQREIASLSSRVIISCNWIFAFDL